MNPKKIHCSSCDRVINENTFCTTIASSNILNSFINDEILENCKQNINQNYNINKDFGYNNEYSGNIENLQNDDINQNNNLENNIFNEIINNDEEIFSSDYSNKNSEIYLKDVDDIQHGNILSSKTSSNEDIFDKLCDIINDDIEIINNQELINNNSNSVESIDINQVNIIPNEYDISIDKEDIIIQGISQDEDSDDDIVINDEINKNDETQISIDSISYNNIYVAKYDDQYKPYVQDVTDHHEKKMISDIKDNINKMIVNLKKRINNNSSNLMNNSNTLFSVINNDSTEKLSLPLGINYDEIETYWSNFQNSLEKYKENWLATRKQNKDGKSINNNSENNSNKELYNKKTILEDLHKSFNSLITNIQEGGENIDKLKNEFINKSIRYSCENLEPTLNELCLETCENESGNSSDDKSRILSQGNLNNFVNIDSNILSQGNLNNFVNVNSDILSQENLNRCDQEIMKNKGYSNNSLSDNNQLIDNNNSKNSLFDNIQVNTQNNSLNSLNSNINVNIMNDNNKSDNLLYDNSKIFTQENSKSSLNSNIQINIKENSNEFLYDSSQVYTQDNSNVKNSTRSLSDDLQNYFKNEIDDEFTQKPREIQNEDN
ncbi:hypothetical protein BCR36DRAFT_330292, partial [Piromyces finnis]